MSRLTIVVPPGVPRVCRWQKVMSHHRHTQESREKPRGADPELSLGLKGDTRPDGRDLEHASQFDPIIDKETRLISNLRWNMPAFVQTVPNVRLSSRRNKAID